MKPVLRERVCLLENSLQKMWKKQNWITDGCSKEEKCCNQERIVEFW